MRRVIFCLGAVAFFLAATSVAASPQGFKVIVNVQNHEASLAKADVAAMLLKKRTHWSDGVSVMAVDQITSATRQAMSLHVFGTRAEAVKNYWMQQIFSGRGIPPSEKDTDEQVVAFV